MQTCAGGLYHPRKHSKKKAWDAAVENHICKKGEKTVQHTKDVIKQGRKLMSTEGAVGA